LNVTIEIIDSSMKCGEFSFHDSHQACEQEAHHAKKRRGEYGDESPNLWLIQ
jgi:hypothetical protein